ncbi:MAG: hypothetical protein K0S86_3922 [Geminicoccaceae bacterium]|nr:hypothetical protein [Geminicoccaceae bacterium]
MTAPFVTQLRARPGVLRLGDNGEGRITVRVQSPEVWDLVRVEAPPGESVLSVKAAALNALMPDGGPTHAFVMKLNGFEVLDEGASLTDAGAKDGSTFLLTYRRRRPVR